LGGRGGGEKGEEEGMKMRVVGVVGVVAWWGIKKTVF
jgi:hypothetical protein